MSVSKTSKPHDDVSQDSSKKRKLEPDVLQSGTPPKKAKHKKSCIFPGCETRPSFGLLTDKIATYCKPHKPPGAVDVVNPRCQHPEGCTKGAGFGLPDGPRLRCKEHKLEGHVNKHVSKNSICKHEDGCTTIATYGKPGDKIVSFCKPHAPEGYEDIKNPRCTDPNCKTRASYGKPGTKSPTFCEPHAPDGYVDVVGVMCIHADCGKHASFGLPNDKKPSTCEKHKLDGYINLCAAICVFEGCTTVASLGKPGTKKALYCSPHAPDNFINVKSAKCTEKGCITTACYGKPEDKVPSHCKKHHIIGQEVDIKNVRCKSDKCTVRASYGMPGHKPVACAQHRTKGMMIYPSRKCIVCKKEQALYGVSEPLHCEKHKNKTDLNLVYRDCVTCLVAEILGDDGQCGRCNEWFGKKLYCYKQRIVRDMLLRHDDIPKFDFYERTINEAECGRERTDMRWDTPTHQVVLEVDENQHHSQPCVCEQTRMVNLTMAIGMPVFWIRYNPDKFNTIWDGLNDDTRHETLRKTIKLCLLDVPKDTADFCRVTYLFFNGTQRGEGLTIDRIPIL